MQSCTIELHTCPLAQLQPKDMSIPKNRTEQITQQKQQIYAYRNQLLTQHLGCAIQQLVFAKHALGKPYLSSHTLAFNHSHSKQHYALALSDTMQDLGVDIEDLNRKVRFDALAQHAFHPEEYQQWVSLDCDPLFWFKVWTCKEAVLKASGFGIRLSLNQLNTQLDPSQQRGICEHADIGTFAYQNIQLAHAMCTVAWRVDSLEADIKQPSLCLYTD